MFAFTAFSCEDDEDIYRGSSTGEYESEVDWNDAANKSTQMFIDYFFKDSDERPGKPLFAGNIYWELPDKIEDGNPPTGYSYGGGWREGHALDVVTDAYIRHAGDSEYQTYLYENVMKPFLPAFDYWNRNCGYGGNDYWNQFYDDMEWMALACLRVYEETDDLDYLDATMKMWNHIKKAKNNYKGVGGLAWKTDAPASRMSCSNGPGCLLAMRLYKLAIEDGRNEDASYYLTFAKEVYSWMTSYLCDVSTGQVYDNLAIQDDGTLGNPDKVALSYNQGTFMGAALALFNATGEDEYLRNAVSFASYQVNKKMDSHYPVFSGEGNSGDNQLFRGIFIRNFLDMVKQPVDDVYTDRTKKKFISALRSCSDVLWKLARPENQYVWEYSWTEPPIIGNRGDETVCKIEGNCEIPGATLVEIRARFENWLDVDQDNEKSNWIGPDFPNTSVENPE